MILLPIKPKYVNKILSWEKKVEFRKNNFFKNEDNLCLIYSSYPVKKIVWFFEYYIDIVDTKDVFKKYWEIWCIDKENLDLYYENREISYILVFKKLTIIEGKKLDYFFTWLKIPQSFSYLWDEYKKKILKTQILSLRTY